MKERYLEVSRSRIFSKNTMDTKSPLGILYNISRRSSMGRGSARGGDKVFFLWIEDLCLEL